jgi:hypothetical protein
MTNTEQPAAAGQEEMQAPVRAGHMEELRFWKRQQWYVAAAGVGLIAGVFQMSQSLKPLACWEKAVASIIVFSVAAGSGLLIWDLQESLKDTRLFLYKNDPNPKRGMRVVCGLWGALLISAVAVIYSFLRSQAHAVLPY